MLSASGFINFHDDGESTTFSNVPEPVASRYLALVWLVLPSVVAAKPSRKLPLRKVFRIGRVWPKIPANLAGIFSPFAFARL
jgi:hypothetical protein